MRASAAGPGIVVTPRSANRLIMGGTSFSFPTAPSVQGDVLAYHVASAALLPTSRAWGIATTQTTGLALANTTAATDAVRVQYGPAAYLAGTARKTDAPAASQIAAFRFYVKPAEGATVITSQFCLESSIAGGSYADIFRLSDTGNLILSAPTSRITCDQIFPNKLGVISDRGSGVSGYTIFTNVTVAAGSGNDPTFIKVPGSAAAAQVGWMKLYIGTAAVVIPYWAAA